MKQLLIFVLLSSLAFAETWKAGFLIYNNGKFGQQWSIKIDGAIYIENPVAPGAPVTYWVRGYPSEYPPIITVNHVVGGTIQVGASLIASSNDTTHKQLVSVQMYSEDGPGGMSDPPLIPVRVQGEEQSAGVVWQTADTTLTANLFREGIDKLAGGGGAAATGGGGENTEVVATMQLAAESAQPTVSVMSESASTAGAAFNSAVSGITDGLRGNITATVPTAPPSLFDISIPRGPAAPVAINLNPLTVPAIASVAAWMKLVLTVLLLIGFEAWVWSQFDDYVKAFVQVPQAKGNTFAGTGGQATGLIAAGILAALITSLPAAFFAVYGGSFTAIGILSSTELMPATQSFFVAAFYVLSAFFPVSVALAVLAQWFVVRKAGTALFGVACIGVKFVVP